MSDLRAQVGFTPGDHVNSGMRISCGEDTDGIVKVWIEWFDEDGVRTISMVISDMKEVLQLSEMLKDAYDKVQKMKAR